MYVGHNAVRPHAFNRPQTSRCPQRLKAYRDRDAQTSLITTQRHTCLKAKSLLTTRNTPGGTRECRVLLPVLPPGCVIPYSSMLAMPFAPAGTAPVQPATPLQLPGVCCSSICWKFCTCVGSWAGIQDDVGRGSVSVLLTRNHTGLHII